VEEALPHALSLSHRDEASLKEAIVRGLRGVLDPETGLDVVRMGLVKDLRIEGGEARCRVILTFRPSSPVCPMAFKLAWDMKRCVRALPGIGSVEVRVEGYNRSAELEAILQEGEEE
jgi:metal-sulfur cluster biosynthetic enzyme